MPLFYATTFYSRPDGAENQPPLLNSRIKGLICTLFWHQTSTQMSLKRYKMKTMTDNIPRRNFPPGRWLGRVVLRLFGWRIKGELPQLSKSVVVVAPHTSNWDFVFGMAAALALDLDANWLGKHTLFKYRPVAWLLTRLGGIPVDRKHPHGIIEEIIDACNARDKFLLGIAPEGTRSPVRHWKTGAYHIAHRAGIPIIPVRIDYRQRSIIILEPFRPGEDMEQVMHTISRLYSAEQAKNPQNFLSHRPEHPAPPPPDVTDC